MPKPDLDAAALGLSAEERIGQILDGRYRLEGVLGIGGLGVVYRAEHTGLRRFVALKLMHDMFADHEELNLRFEREARALSALDHPNIVAISDFGTHEGAPYLAMQLIEGQSLSSRLANGPLPIAETIEILRQVLDALVAAHAGGVVHRDLKPGNIMLEEALDGDLRARIVDFGLAKIAVTKSDGAADPTLTKLGTIIGSPSYMAPEQTTAQATDERADLYALGIILYEMLVGRCPFVNEDKRETVRAHLTATVPRPESLRRGLTLSPELDALLFTALAKDREERHASAEEMRAAALALPVPAAVAPGEALSEREPAAAQSERSASARSPLDTLRSLNPAWLALAFALSVVGVLAMAATLVVVALSTAEDDDTTGATGDDGGEMPIGVDLPPPGARHPASDPLSFDVPDALRPELEIVRGGGTLERAQQRALQEYQSEHMEDARASLILAHGYANQRWNRDAIRRYEMVHRIDPSARGNRWMREDLLRMIAAPTHGTRAVTAVRRIYGDEVIPDIERRLAEEAVDGRERHRLELLLRRVQ